MGRAFATKKALEKQREEEGKKPLNKKQKEEWNTNIQYLETLGEEFGKETDLSKYKLN